MLLSRSVEARYHLCVNPPLTHPCHALLSYLIHAPNPCVPRYIRPYITPPWSTLELLEQNPPSQHTRGCVGNLDPAPKRAPASSPGTRGVTAVQLARPRPPSAIGFSYTSHRLTLLWQSSTASRAVLHNSHAEYLSCARHIPPSATSRGRTAQIPEDHHRSSSKRETKALPRQPPPPPASHRPTARAHARHPDGTERWISGAPHCGPPGKIFDLFHRVRIRTCVSRSVALAYP